MDRLEHLAAIERDIAPKIIAPFLTMTKTEVFKLGAAMGVPYDLTWSCLRADALHCGQCTACRARRRAFAEAGLVDPMRYKEPAASHENQTTETLDHAVRGRRNGVRDR